MPAAYWVELARTVRRSLGRFVAIAVITAVGCGFFAGLHMTGVGMRRTADAYFDRNRLYDIELVSTMGFSKDAAARVADVEGISSVAEGRSVDVMASLDGASLACRIASLPKEGSLNGLILEEGRWPAADDECVLVRRESSPGMVGQTVDVLYGSQDLDPILATRSFTVVGTVSSPAYACEATFAVTTLGSGTVGDVAFVPDGAFTDDAPVTELYLSVTGAQDELWGTDAYQARLDEVAARVEVEADALATARLAEVTDDAQAEVDRGRAEYKQAERDAADGLGEGQKALDEARGEVEDGRRALDDGTAALDQKTKELADGRREWERSRARYEEAKASCEEGAARLTAAEAELAEKEASVKASREALEAQRPAVEEARAQVSAFDTGLGQLIGAASSAGIDADTASEVRGLATERADQLKAAQGAGQQVPVGAIEAFEALAAQAGQLAASEGAVASARDAVAQFDAAERELVDGEAQVATARERLATERTKLDAAAEQLEAGAAKLEQGRHELDQGEALLAEGRDELARSASQLEDGERQLQAGETELEQKREEAAASLAEAKAAIDDGQAEVDALEPPEVFVLDRTANYGARSFLSDSERIDAIASVFPFFFFVVAALVTLTTMTRMVDDDRGLIGTYKALGISDGAVCLKYVAYGFLASAVGALVGIAVMSQLIPGVIFKAYDIIYAVPARPMPLPVEAAPAAVAAALGVGVTLAATLGACLSSLRESAASLMQPKAPKAGKRILLESIGPVWRRLSFSWKVTCRNIFRYKRRLAMTVVGVAGCTGLLLCGFGVRDAVNDILDKQFGELTFYNAVVGMDDGSTVQEIDAVADRLAAAPVALVARENLVARDGDGDDRSVTLMVPDDPAAFADTTVLRERVGGRSLDLADGAVLTEKTASLLGVGPGDTVSLYRQDETGNATGGPVEVRVAGVCEAYLGSYLYLSPEGYREAFGTTAVPDTVLGSVPDGASGTEEADGLMAMDGVSTVQLSAETIETYRTMLSSVDLVMVVLIVFAAILAFVVMYNLANINIAERSREVASLKVLGFFPAEVDAYIFREIVIIAALGAVAGLFLGTVFEAYVVVTAEVDAAMFGREIHPLSYLCAFLLTLVFCAVVLLAMRPKIAAIDMVESLKSVE